MRSISVKSRVPWSKLANFFDVAGAVLGHVRRPVDDDEEFISKFAFSHFKNGSLNCENVN